MCIIEIGDSNLEFYCIILSVLVGVMTITFSGTVENYGPSDAGNPGSMLY